MVQQKNVHKKKFPPYEVKISPFRKAKYSIQVNCELYLVKDLESSSDVLAAPVILHHFLLHHRQELVKVNATGVVLVNLYTVWRN